MCDILSGDSWFIHWHKYINLKNIFADLQERPFHLALSMDEVFKRIKKHEVELTLRYSSSYSPKEFGKTGKHFLKWICIIKEIVPVILSSVPTLEVNFYYYLDIWLRQIVFYTLFCCQIYIAIFLIFIQNLTKQNTKCIGLVKVLNFWWTISDGGQKTLNCHHGKDTNIKQNNNREQRKNEMVIYNSFIN